ncbi:MAG TPA: carboxypeptidase-like regulatory domain-containing protein [Methylococcus sp.]|nr:carboxypeptidase-like regulatory domain-containing protein [Methylococcus sp.]
MESRPAPSSARFWAPGVAILSLLMTGSGCNSPEGPPGPGIGAERPVYPADRGRELTGRVTNIRGEPVRGAVVLPKSLDDPPRPVPEIAVLTDEQGTYIWRLPPGTYRIHVSARGYRSASRDVTVRENARTTLDITLEPEDPAGSPD